MGKKSKNKTKKKSEAPSSRAGHLMLRCRTGILLIGGYNEGGVLEDVWRYRDENRWEEVCEKSKPLTSRMMYDGCFLNVGVYVFGGIRQEDEEVSIFNDCWIFEEDICSWRLLWEECPIPERFNHVVLGFDNKLFIHGGECMGTLGDCWLHDTSNGTFSNISSTSPNYPSPRSNHSAVYCAPYVFLFGGINVAAGDTQYYNDMWTFDTLNMTWNPVSCAGIAPSPRDMCTLVATSRNQVIIYGGYGFAETDVVQSDSDSKYDSEGEVENKVHDDKGVLNGKQSEDSLIVTSLLSNGTMHQNTEEVLKINHTSLDDKANPTDASFFKIVEEVTPAIDSLSMHIGHVESIRISVSDAKIIRDQEKEDSSGEDDETVVECYLSDGWIVDVSAGVASAIEFDMSDVVYNGFEPHNRIDSNVFGGCRGMKMCVNPAGNTIKCFGGYDGSRFLQDTFIIDERKLQNNCSSNAGMDSKIDIEVTKVNI